MAPLAEAVIVADLSGTFVRARPPLFGAAKPDDFFAAYQSAFGRTFPANLLPEGSLRVIGDRHGRRFARKEAPALRRTQQPPRRTDRIQLLIGATRGPQYWPGKFSRRDFVRDCPKGYFLAGFDRNWMGLLRFYYVRRDEWSLVLFRLPCGGGVPDFLDAFAAFLRTVKPHINALVACEKSNNPLASQYEIAMENGGVRQSNRSQFDEPDFADLAIQLLGKVGRGA
jgi:hypothetical protein